MLRGMAHVTGGGITGNLPRMLPEPVCAVVRRGSWEVPPIFSVIQAEGGLNTDEMYRVFNMGIGFVVSVRPADAAAVTAVGGGVVIGDVLERRAGQDALTLA